MLKKIALGFVAAAAISVPLAPIAAAQTDSAGTVSDQVQNIGTQIQGFFNAPALDAPRNCILCLNPGPQPRPCILCIPPGVVFGNGR